MIVRILGEAQFDVPDEHRDTLDRMDHALVDAVDAGDESAFEAALVAVTAEVRKVGQVLGDDAFTSSELIVPFADASLDETRRLLAGDTAPDGS
jgi:hypothetical protein